MKGLGVHIKVFVLCWRKWEAIAGFSADDGTTGLVQLPSGGWLSRKWIGSPSSPLLPTVTHLKQ